MDLYRALANPIVLIMLALSLTLPARGKADTDLYPLSLPPAPQMCLAQNWDEPKVQGWLDKIADRRMRMKIYGASGLPVRQKRCLMEAKAIPVDLCNKLIANVLQVPGEIWNPREIPEDKFVDVTRRVDDDTLKACFEMPDAESWDTWTPSDLAPDRDTADILARAQKGDLAAMHQAMELYRIGDKVPQDGLAILDLMNRLAQGGDADMQLMLGRIYRFGIPVPFSVNEEKARELLTKAAEQGNAEAMYLLDGLIAANSPKNGSQKDPAQEKTDRYWLFKAAEAGNGQALAKLARRARTDEERMAYLHRAVEADDPGAMHMLAERLNTPGKDYNPQKAQKWARRADGLGLDGKSKWLMNYFPWGTAPAAPEAMALIQERHAREDHDLDAMLAVAKRYNDGTGFTKDESQAVTWWRKAADKGDPIGMRMLGLSLLRGQGIAMDSDEAISWLERAADLSDGEAAAILSRWHRTQGPKQPHLLDRIRFTNLSIHWADKAKATGYSEWFLSM